MMYSVMEVCPLELISLSLRGPGPCPPCPPRPQWSPRWTGSKKGIFKIRVADPE